MLVVPLNRSILLLDSFILFCSQVKKVGRWSQEPPPGISREKQRDLQIVTVAMEQGDAVIAAYQGQYESERVESSLVPTRRTVQDGPPGSIDPRRYVVQHGSESE